MLRPFFYFNLSSPGGIATCSASAGNIAAGALIQTNTLYYCSF
jgi:hypothetical protein